jgi:predicted enzyme related to lactoylglutathione lyase
MGYFDCERRKKFYQTAFDWQLQQKGPKIGNYVLAHTAETDENGMVKTPDTINGGFYKKTDNHLSHPPSVVIAVQDIHGSMKAVEAAGGKILLGAMDEKDAPRMVPMTIPGVGLWISIEDTEGNRVSLLQPNAR